MQERENTLNNHKYIYSYGNVDKKYKLIYSPSATLNSINETLGVFSKLEELKEFI